MKTYLLEDGMKVMAVKEHKKKIKKFLKVIQKEEQIQFKFVLLFVIINYSNTWR